MPILVNDLDQYFPVMTDLLSSMSSSLDAKVVGRAVLSGYNLPFRLLNSINLVHPDGNAIYGTK